MLFMQRNLAIVSQAVYSCAQALPALPACHGSWLQVSCTNDNCSQMRKKMTISKGKTVAITYTLTLDNGETVDSNVDTEPLTFTQGSNEIIPGLENALEGKKTGDTFKVSVQPEDGYGVLSDEAFIDVPKEHLPPEAREIGAQLTAVGPEGQELYGVVIEMVEEIAKLDFNHPLAGEVLH